MKIQTTEAKYVVLAVFKIRKREIETSFTENPTKRPNTINLLAASELSMGAIR